MQLIRTSMVSPKGQVVVPVGMRDKYGIKPGEKVVWIDLPAKAGVLLRPKIKGSWRRIRGSLKGLMSMEEFMKQREEEGKIEEEEIRGMVGI